MANARNCGPLETRLDCFEFIKLHNASPSPVSLESFRVRFGNGNDSSGIANTVHLQGELAGDSYMVVKQRDDGRPLAITASSGHVWLEDTYGFKAYPATVIDYKDIGAKSYQGFAWGFDGEGWRWALSTDGPNDFRLPSSQVVASESDLKPCRSDQYRNPETNRCRLLAAQASTLKPCSSDQYRSPETNRCRNLATAASSLKPCKADQYRNPDTNRCRSILGASSKLKPCKANQERNPETNRCRNIKATEPPSAAFAVEPIEQTASAFVGWWALGGLGLLAAGYGAWEWRSELLVGIKRIGTFFTSSK